MTFPTLKIEFNHDKTRFSISGNTVELARYLEQSEHNEDSWGEKVVVVTNPAEMVQALLNIATVPELMNGRVALSPPIINELGNMFYDAINTGGLSGTENANHV